eukprot:TRINITY_DN41978_c0_g1_i1.p1 TRINITY_DN41978_c0_g1~~TRINITY_DN41978_c0_g1_i1.p1  ORF type:complete len:532 (-),score=109.79 TRINITY_DN41978_c0_g1_i1:129-1682(-)
MGCGGSTEPNYEGGKAGTAGTTECGNVSTLGVHPHFVAHKDKRLDELYKVATKSSGKGSYGAVFIATNRTTDQKRAVKAVERKVFNAKEIGVMKTMDHPNICKLFETFEDKKKMYLVMELCEGGELFDVIISAGTFTEKQAAYVMQSMFRPLNYLHTHGLTHRDLKPENFLVMEKVTGAKIQETTIKLIDFGLATSCKPGQVLTTKAGTPYYVAPEVLAGSYTESADMWSLGVIMYILLCGYPPFNGDSNNQILDNVRRGQVTFPNAEWRNISGDAKELVKALLTKDYRDRCSAAKALENTWIAEKAPQSGAVAIGASFVDNLRSFRSLNQLKKTALQVIASNVKESKIKALQETFTSMDKNGDGSLTTQELHEALGKAGLLESVPDLNEIVSGIDVNHSGVIDYREFLAATLDKRSLLQDTVLWQAFAFFDKNDDGKISRKELQDVLADDGVKSLFAEELEHLMNEVDTNGDGEIDFEEFKVMMIKDLGGTSNAKEQAATGNSTTNNTQLEQQVAD